MKPTLAFLVLLLFNCALFAQNQDSTQKSFLKYAFNYTGDFVRNFKGGIKTGNAYLGMADVSVSLDFGQAGLWNGGQLVARGLLMHGGTPSADLVGDIQVFSNIEAGNFTSFYEMYYQQTFDNLNFKIGQQDMNADFVTTEHGGFFVNSSFGIMPCFSANMNVPIFPIAGLGASLEYKIADKWYGKSAIFDGHPGTQEDTHYGTRWKMNKQEGYLLLQEINWYPNGKQDAENCLKLGLSHHTASAGSLKDPDKVIKGNTGFYAILDKTLVSGDQTKLNGFLQAGIFPNEQNLVSQYYGTGLVLRPVFGKNDQAGIAAAFAKYNKYAFNTDRLHAETSFDLEYEFLFQRLKIKPVVQYIVHHGHNIHFNNSLIGMVRLSFGMEN
jgi:porin